MTWVRQAPGWYTSERGVIWREREEWWLLVRRDERPLFGPYRTLAEAKRAAEAE